ncbi:DUF3071 domain-containing protein [Spiractinospora alimapuensis]|uniref:septation protein SepH n=1 Tax=Spiractinospora alimapuensis TaxID=2820884 RepID=UPI001EEE3D53|nr:septation protein SepH [Spiractinospora alimapuensis]QVQ52394.1 DUF3071 domain-containing protein [Spiractinospora alimapuensis]
MQELRLVAVSEDGAFLVLASTGRGTRFMLPVDDRLRAAVRGQFSRLGQFEIEVENPLRPKEIQARIRSGETAEAIAELSGLPIDRVRWFEGPVLQEREYMAQQAQRAVVRTPGDATPGPTLGDLVSSRIGQTQMDSGEAVWDSWKREDNTWRVRLAYTERGEDLVAHWSYDPRRRSVAPEDDEAARFSRPDAAEEPAPDTNVAFFQPRRPAEPHVPADPAPARRPVPPDAVGPLAPPPIPLIDGPSVVTPLTEERPSAEHPDPSGPAEREDEADVEAGAVADPAPVAEPETVAPPAPEPEPAPAAAEEVPPVVEPEREVVEPPVDPAAEAPPAPAKRARAPITAAAAGTKTAAAATGDSAASRRQRAKGRGRRASVPSWDEIMFGSRKSE